MALQKRSESMMMPVAPEQEGGWCIPFVFHGKNLSWTVCTRRGSVILRVENLTQAEVEAFDANKENKRVR